MSIHAYKQRPIAVAVGMVAGLAGVAGHQGARAQDDVSLEEVVVTAQRREESLLETPVAVTTFDSVQLEELKANSLDQLQGYVPSLSIAPFAADSAAPVVFIRGMGNVDVQTTKDAAVGVYLDGVALGRATGLALDIADLERIEVLRGPQGTLYGRNTTAGAINYVTRKPHDEFAAKLRLSTGNYNYGGAQLDLNLPVTERFFVKFGYMRDRIDGWVDNDNVSGLPNQADPNEHDNEAYKAALRWKPTDNFTADYAFDYSDLEYGNGYYQVVQASAAPPGVSDFSTVTPTSDRQDSAMLARGLSPSTVRTKGHNLTLAWDVGAVTLKSITGYRELNGDLFQNYLDGLNYVSDCYLLPPTDPGFGQNCVSPPASEFIQTNSVDQDQFSQELQVLGSALEDSIQYVAGLYYFREKSTEMQGGNYAWPPGTPNYPGYDVVDSWSVDAKAESYALYGQASWRPNALSQKLGFTLGLRQTEDDREATKEFIRADLPPLPPFENDAAQPGDTRSGKKDFSNTSGQFIVDYFFTDDINSYFKYATGYRSGGFSTRSLVTEFADGFEPETVQSYELGFKSQLWERRLRLNAAAYYNDYTDLQVDTYIPLANGRTLNAGQATIQGVEIEAVARLTRGLTVDAFYAFMDADYDEYIDNGVDLSGVKKVPQAPRNQAKGGVEYAFPMTGLGQITARLDYLWTDEFWSNPDSNNRNDAYGLLNARVQWLGIPLPAGNIRVALWGKNLTDEEYTVLTTDFSGGDNNPVDAFRTVAAQYGTPRTYGLDFIYEY